MDLSKRAMLVKSRIELKGLLGERRDQGATLHVEETYNVAVKRAKVAKHLIAQNARSVKLVRSSAQSIRECVYKHTFPWLDTDMRLLPAKNHDIFRREHDQRTASFWDSVGSYINDYSSLVEEASHPAPRGLGALFDPNQYPAHDRVKDMFKASLEYWPMPSANNFVADIANEAAEQAKKGMEAKLKQVVDNSFNEIIARCEKVVAHFVDKVSNYKPAGTALIQEVGLLSIYNSKPENIFRDSLVENMTDLAGLIRNLNFTDDLAIEQMAVSLERLTRYSPDTLRTPYFNVTRTEITDEGKQFLAKIETMKKTDDDVSAIMDAAKDYI